MASTEQQERRRQENQCLSILVDLGVTYRRTLGDRVATAFFNANAIPSTVTERIMTADCPRRLTDWERQAERIGAWRTSVRTALPVG